MNPKVNIFPDSQRGAFLLLEQPRSRQRLSPTVPYAVELTLRDQLRGLVSAHPRYGYRRLHVLLVRENFRVNHKQVQLLCCDEGLRVSVEKRKRARIG